MENGKNLFISFAKFFTPFFLAGIVALILFFSGPEIYAKLGAILLTYSFTPVGRMSILASPALDLDIWMVVAGIVFADADSSLFITWNFDLVTKIPFLGALILKTEEKGYEYLVKYPWIRRLAVIGIALFVAIPFMGTNAIVATIMGRIIGMDALRTWLSVVGGSFFGSILVALPAYGISTWL
ncbi:MAG: small multi-drug export protein [Candidatus Syntropharchaeia archaeon]